MNRRHGSEIHDTRSGTPCRKRDDDSDCSSVACWLCCWRIPWPVMRRLDFQGMRITTRCSVPALRLVMKISPVIQDL